MLLSNSYSSLHCRLYVLWRSISWLEGQNAYPSLFLRSFFPLLRFVSSVSKLCSVDTFLWKAMKILNCFPYGWICIVALLVYLPFTPSPTCVVGPFMCLCTGVYLSGQLSSSQSIISIVKNMKKEENYKSCYKQGPLLMLHCLRCPVGQTIARPRWKPFWRWGVNFNQKNFPALESGKVQL